MRGTNVLQAALSRHPWSKSLYAWRLPYFKPYAAVIAETYAGWKLAWAWARTVLWYDQMIRYFCDCVGSPIFFHGTFPLILNRGHVVIGDRVTFVGQNNLIVGLNVPHVPRPELVIGNDVVVGYRCEINVAQSVRIGHHVKIATGVKIFDNNSHPVDARKRRLMAPLTRADVAPVTIHDGAWIGMEAAILKGVTIGRGAIVGIGSVVTRSVPDHVIVAGNPAKIIKAIAKEPTEDLLQLSADAAESVVRINALSRMHRHRSMDRKMQNSSSR